MNILPVAAAEKAPGMVADLRQLLREKFPEAHRTSAEEAAAAAVDCFETGLPCLDRIGLPHGSVTEIVSAGSGSGSGIMLASLIINAARRRRYAALIDGRDSFDPQSLGPDACDTLLWVRCREVKEVLKAADLLLRDGNLSLVLLDLVLNATRELAKVPSGVWFRLRNLVESSGTVLVTFTARRVISSAHLRLSLDKTLSLEAFDHTQEELEKSLAPQATGRHARSPSRDAAAG